MMHWPDLALREETDLIFRHPRCEPPEGLVIVKADLTAFFGLVESVGRNEALLLLLVKALRTRYGPFRLRVYDLAWRMRVGHHRVIRWLDRLVAARLVVYTLQDLLERDTVEVEIIATPTTALFEHSRKQELPTHWFEHVLPLLGRTTFTVFLYLLANEERGAFHIDLLVTAARLQGRWEARRHLERLRRYGVLLPNATRAGWVVNDPPPLSQLQHLRLRFLRQPYLRRAFLQISALLVVLANLLLSLVFVRRLP
jgi:hypothetical protein